MSERRVSESSSIFLEFCRSLRSHLGPTKQNAPGLGRSLLHFSEWGIPDISPTLSPLPLLTIGPHVRTAPGDPAAHSGDRACRVTWDREAEGEDSSEFSPHLV